MRITIQAHDLKAMVSATDLGITKITAINPSVIQVDAIRGWLQMTTTDGVIHCRAYREAGVDDEGRAWIHRSSIAGFCMVAEGDCLIETVESGLRMSNQFHSVVARDIASEEIVFPDYEESVEEVYQLEEKDVRALRLAGKWEIKDGEWPMRLGFSVGLSVSAASGRGGIVHGKTVERQWKILPSLLSRVGFGEGDWLTLASVVVIDRNLTRYAIPLSAGESRDGTAIIRNAQKAAVSRIKVNKTDLLRNLKAAATCMASSGKSANVVLQADFDTLVIRGTEQQAEVELSMACQPVGKRTPEWEIKMPAEQIVQVLGEMPDEVTLGFAEPRAPLVIFGGNGETCVAIMPLWN